MKDSNQLPNDFEEKLMQKIKTTVFSKSFFEVIIIVFLSTFQIFVEFLVKVFPSKQGD